MPPLHDAADAARAVRSAIDCHAELDPHVKQIQGELMQVLHLLDPAQAGGSAGADAVRQAASLFDSVMHTHSRKAQRLAYAVKVLAELMQQQSAGGRGPTAETISQDVIPPRRLPATAAEAPHEEGMSALPLEGDADTASMLVDIQENLEDVDALGS